MTHEHRADVALRALAELPVPEASPHVEALQRRKIIERLERLQVEGSRAAPPKRLWRHAIPIRRGMAAIALAAVAAAAAVLVTRAPESSTEPAAHLAQPPATLAPAERPLATGSEVKTEVGSTVQLKTTLGAKISVAGSSELRLAGSEASGTIERVDLALGSIRVKVPKLGAKRQFRVSTPDTLVIVHGTEFSVSVRKDADGRTNTVVEVTSGRVEVRKQRAVEFLNAGAAWSSRASTATPEPKPDPESKPASTTSPPSVATPAAAPRGTLAQANALLASALEASRQGNDTLALTRLDELLRRYPDSPVADNARVERFRTLRRLGRDQDAARAASKYLKGDPDGFARDEARELGK